jgi:hypothetical protein
MSRKTYLTPSGLSHKLHCDTQTVVNRFQRGQLEAQAFLRKGSKLIPLFEADEEVQWRTHEAQLVN